MFLIFMHSHQILFIFKHRRVLRTPTGFRVSLPPLKPDGVWKTRRYLFKIPSAFILSAFVYFVKEYLKKTGSKTFMSYHRQIQNLFGNVTTIVQHFVLQN